MARWRHGVPSFFLISANREPVIHFGLIWVLKETVTTGFFTRRNLCSVVPFTLNKTFSPMLRSSPCFYRQCPSLFAPMVFFVVGSSNLSFLVGGMKSSISGSLNGWFSFPDLSILSTQFTEQWKAEGHHGNLMKPHGCQDSNHLCHTYKRCAKKTFGNVLIILRA